MTSRTRLIVNSAAKQIGEAIGHVGMVVAAVVSFEQWHSYGWAICHAYFGWLYVLYHWMAY